ncbi:hypothetical protein PROFUN_00327 [Planoprotostelium fungivorum]|uniref:Vacuolar protein sorting-associated protein n=1 Tax=Planoprotostelium fungivorum TaxID=1890364 RepID=A0A2P6NY36_9EUKA|nr:hypothetical protein PROFUN_00327 [Planoprotostelium fungivorum]
MVFEGIVSDLLLKYLGDYIKNLNRDGLKIGIWGGDVVLQDLEINKDALNNLGLPFELKHGIIGKLVLKVPWQSLKSKPVVVQVSEVLVVLRPQFHSYGEYDEKAEKKRNATAKRARIDNAELMKSIKNETAQDKSDGFVAKMATKIIDNIQIDISQIHVRIEDDLTNPNFPFSIGFCIDRVAVSSTDEEWREIFIEGNSGKLIHKLAKLSSLSVYMDPMKTVTKESEGLTTLKERMNREICSEERSAPHHFVVSPISAALRLVINTADLPDMNVPKIAAELVFENINLGVEKIQYQTVLKLVDSLASFERVKENLKFRPKIRPNTPAGARIWWKYAGNAILNPIRDKIKRKSWAFMLQRRTLRKEYISLYKRAQGKKWLKPLKKKGEDRMKELEEDILDINDILFFRSLGDAELKVEQQNAEEVDAKEKKNRGWFGGWFGGSSTNTKEERAMIQLSEEQRNELYHAIDYSEAMEFTELPREVKDFKVDERNDKRQYVKMKGKVQVKEASLRVIGSEGDGEIIHGSITNIGASAHIRGSGLKAKLSIGSIEVMDRWTKNSLYPKMITRSNQASEDALLLIEVDLNPLDHHADLAVDLKIDSNDVFVNHTLLVKLAQTFEPEGEVMVATEIRDKAKESARALTQSGQAQLADIIASHKTIDLKLSLKAPRIIIPEDVRHKDTSLLVVDLGRLEISTDLQRERSDVRSERDFYDKFDISLTKVHVLLVPKASQEWLKLEEQKKYHMHLIEEISVLVSFFNCIDPNEVTLSKMKVEGVLPKFQINVSPKKTAQLLRLLKVFIASDTSKLEQVKSNPRASITLPKGPSNSKPVEIPIIADRVSQLTEEERSRLHKRVLIDAKFQIEQVNVILSHDDNKREVEFIKFSLDHLTATFLQRTYDMTASVQLSFLQLEDLIGCDGPNSRHLITSSGIDMQEEDDDVSHLVKIRFHKMDKESPDYEQTKIESQVDFHFDSLWIVVNQGALALLMRVGLKQYLPLLDIIATNNKDSLPTETSGEVTPRGTIVNAAAVKRRQEQKVKPRSDITMKVSANIKQISIMLNDNEQVITEFSIKNIEVHLQMYDKIMEAMGSIEDMELVNVLGAARYQQILSVVTDETRDQSQRNMLDFHYNTYDPTVQGYPNYDMYANLSMRSIRLVFLNGFVTQLQQYFLQGHLMKTLQSMEKEDKAASISNHRMKRATMMVRNSIRNSVSLTPKKKSNVPEPKEKVVRIKLDVQIRTPQILIPRDSNSSEKILVELGELTLTNSFDSKSAGDNNNIELDVLHMTITSINVRSYINSLPEMKLSSSADEENLVAVPLLKDVKIELFVTRLIDIKYNDYLPQFSVKSDISSINFQFTETQMELILSTLNGNLKEGQDINASEKVKQVVEEKVEAAATPIKKEKKKDRLKTQLIASTMGREAAQLAVVEITLEKISLVIIPGTAIKPDDAIASFQINHLTLSSKMYTDNSMKAQVYVHRMSLTDKRMESRNEFRNIIDCGSISSSKHLMTVDYSKSSLGDQRIQLEVNSPAVYVVPDTLFAILNFFLTPLAKVNLSQPKPKPVEVIEEKEKENVVPDSTLIADVKLNHLELVLPHKPRKANTRAMVLKTSVFVRYLANVDEASSVMSEGGDEFNVAISSEPIESAEINVRNFQAFVFYPGLNNDENSSILRPLDIAMVYSNQPSVMRVNVKVKPVSLVVTYQDFKLAMGILSEIQKYQPESQSTAVHKPEEKEESVAVVKKSITKRESLQFSCPSVYVTLINDFEGRKIPLISLSVADTLVTVANWSSDMDATVEFRTSIDYYNNFVVKFEPLIEDYTMKIVALKRREPQMHISMKSNDILNVNLSHAFIDNLGTLRSILDRDYFVEKKETNEKEKRAFSPYWIFNKTGGKISIKMEEMSRDMANGEECAIGYNTIQAKSEASNHHAVRYASVKINNTIIPQFSLDKVGTQQFSLEGSPVPVLCKISVEEGSKWITLQSPATMMNTSTLSVHVAFFPDESSKFPSCVLGPITPDSQSPIPLSFVNKGIMIIKGADDSSSWNVSSPGAFSMEAFKALSSGGKTNQIIKKSIKISDGNRILMTGTTNRTEEGITEIQITMQSPVMIENALPEELEYRLYHDESGAMKKINSGDRVGIYDVSAAKQLKLAIKVQGYQESKPVIISTEESDSKKKNLMRAKVMGERETFINLHIERVTTKGGIVLVIYCPYWIINHSTMDLQFRQRVIGSGVREPTFNAPASPKPILFSYTNDVPGGNRIKMKGKEEGKWSKAFNIESVGTTGIISFEGINHQKYQVGASLYLAEGKFSRTRVVEIMPKYIIENGCDATLLIKQYGTIDKECRIRTGEHTTFDSWISQEGTKEQICIKIANGRCDWSSPFNIDALSSFHVKLNDHNQSYVLYTIEINQESATTVVRVRNSEQTKSPYKIVNHTKYDITAHQKDAANLSFVVPAEGEKDYAWDLPTSDPVIMLSSTQIGIKASVELDVLDTLDPVKSKSGIFYMYIKTESASSRVLYITQDKNKYDKETNPQNEKVTSIEFEMMIAGAGVSIIDSVPRELFYITVDKMYFAYRMSNVDQTIQLILDDFQVDNQLFDTQYPVMISYLEKKEPKKRLPFLRFTLVKDLEHANIDYTSYMSLSVQEMSIKVDTQLINAASNFVSKLPLAGLTATTKGPIPTQVLTVTATELVGSQARSDIYPAGIYYLTYAFSNGIMGPITRMQAATSFSALTITNIQVTAGQTRTFYLSSHNNPLRGQYKKFHTIGCDNGEDKKSRVIVPVIEGEEQEDSYNGTSSSASENEISRKMYFKLLVLNPIKLNLTFTMLSNEYPYIFRCGVISYLITLLGDTFANLDNAPIRLNALIIQEAFCEMSDLQSRIQTHYTRQVIQEVYKILGSADFLGNPVGLFNSFSKGVGDFFFEPAAGLIEGPDAFGKGLAKGTFSLLKNSLYGTFNTASKLTGVAGKLLSKISFDNEYIAKRQRKKANRRAKHAGDGVMYGIQALSSGIKEGVVGVVTQPMKGAREGGALGLIRGIGKGLVGLPIKPAVGAVDLLTHTTEGIRNTATMFEKEDERARQPRHIGGGGVISNYSKEEANGRNLLNLLDNGAFKNEEYIYHAPLFEQRVVVITDQTTIMIDVAKPNEPSMVWNVRHEDVTLIGLEQNGVLMRFDYEPGCAIIHCENENLALLLRMKLAAVVRPQKTTRRQKVEGKKPVSMEEEPHSPGNKETSGQAGYNGLHTKERENKISKIEMAGGDLNSDVKPSGERRKKETLQLILQALDEMGLGESVKTLEKESGIILQEKTMYPLFEAISAGSWDVVIKLLDDVSFHRREDGAKARNLVNVQIYLEHLENRNISEALNILQTNLAGHTPPEQLSQLSRLIICSKAEEVRREGRWDGAQGSSRGSLVDKIKSLLSPEGKVCVPSNRLDTLLDQAVKYQKTLCLYHNNREDQFSLYIDHVCEREQLPSQCIAVLESHSDEVWYIKFSHSGRYLASSSKDNTIIIWDLTLLPDAVKKSRKLLTGHLGGVTSLSWSYDDTKILSCSLDHVIKIWDTSAGDCLQTFDRHTEAVTSCAWFPDGIHFVSGSDDKSVYLWNVQSSTVIREWEESTKVNGVAVSKDGSRMVLVCGERKIHVIENPLSSDWDSSHPPPRFTLEDQHPVVSMDLSSDGRHLVVFSLPSTDVHVWDLEERKIVSYLHKDHTENRMVIFPCFGGPNENFIASGNSQIYIWHNQSERLLSTLEGHCGTVNAVSWTYQRDSILASCSDDRTIRVWVGKSSPLYQSTL